ncbi:Nif3-like dinuclear metal center hexameric protein [Bacillus suaedaesalsae]|uniref:GTP cyclohydrolase 1 type 2 homolog n=1 Tax=Bacillus suaedaesalsae TaxID=2810349 RepID=A0ABS2DL73_9BACI|nr:Nif3-like dinuclear metal center hexameric protein [Bacillus suaedaesalsae]MBM6618780.1 Nif3-like dinuclear metal center hexameric protein [Bacillus suaedaesalsae]
MKLEQFKETIENLFGTELLQQFHDDFGYTNTSNTTISKVGYSTNLSLEVIERAAVEKVDLLVTHHDAWDFIYGLQEACVKKLEEYNISHFWIHGPLDYIDFGTSTALMNELRVDTVIRHSMYIEGDIPGIGKFTDPIEFDKLVERMTTALDEPVRAWKNNQKKVKKIGILTGAGHSTDNIRKAFEEGCDTYITGEATLYTIQYAQFIGINLLVGSHTFTEIFGVESLVKKLQENHLDLTIVRIEEEHFELTRS